MPRGTPFTYLKEGLTAKGHISPTSNRIENPDERIRRMLSLHRGMNVEHRVKAVFWFCYMNSECPLPYARMLEEFPSNAQAMERRCQAAKAHAAEEDVARWGQDLVWSKLHMSGSKTIGWF